jgi:hypothetical protein
MNSPKKEWARKSATPESGAAAEEASAYTIFLDLDGVIADFDKHAEDHGKKDASGNVIRDALDFEWWVSMPAFNGAQAFYDSLKRRGDVKFLTGPMLSSDCYGGKAAWIEKFHPKRGKWLLKDLIICNSNDKGLLAGPARILIDDRAKNIREWRAAGGIGVLHTGDFAETLQKLDRLMEARANKPQQPKP